jgi:hypothetical protein
MADSQIPALSVRQPWAFGIIYAGKDIENRDWSTRYRGPVLIHAGLYKPTSDDAAEFNDVWNTAMTPGEIRSIIESVGLKKRDDLQRGGIIGQAEIADCVERSTSKWFFGRYGFVLRNAKPLPFAPCKGKFGFFKPEFASEAANG